MCVCVSCYPHLRLTHTLSGRSQLPLPLPLSLHPAHLCKWPKKKPKAKFARSPSLSVCLSVPLSICLFDNILEHMCVLTVGKCMCMCVSACVCVCYLCVMFVLCLLRGFLIFHSPLWHGEFVPPVQLTANRWRLAIKMPSLLTHSLPWRYLLSPTVLGQRRDSRISKNDIEILQKFKNH